MIKVNGNILVEKGDKNMLGQLLAKTNPITMLIILGVVECPKVGQTIKVSNSATGTGEIVEVDLVNCRIKYTYIPVKFYKEDGSDWSWSQSERYSVRKVSDKESIDSMPIDAIQEYTLPE
jgi:hypothetical protein